MKKPIAVLISDIHFTPATLDVASIAFKKAQIKALDLGVTLVVCGDTLDTKAIMRAECVNRLIELVTVIDAPPTIFLVGNHDMLNEKSKEHTLNFLKPYCVIVDRITTSTLSNTYVTMIPYQNDTQAVKNILADEDTTGIVIMHQGIKYANGGHYYQDATAIDPDWGYGRIIISGHYHARQGLELPEGGSFDYVGNPYTLNFGEANDLDKGFQVLYDNGELEFIPTNLRKHVVLAVDAEGLDTLIPSTFASPQDLVWLKIQGTEAQLQKIDRNYLITKGWPSQLKLDLIPAVTEFQPVTPKDQTQEELLDSVIDSINTDDSQKQLLKNMWREMR